jgi:hypothetical protein
MLPMLKRAKEKGVLVTSPPVRELLENAHTFTGHAGHCQITEQI